MFIRSPRFAFTLIEIVVVIAILIGLLLPAVRNVREAGQVSLDGNPLANGEIAFVANAENGNQSKVIFSSRTRKRSIQPRKIMSSILPLARRTGVESTRLDDEDEFLLCGQVTIAHRTVRTRRGTRAAIRIRHPKGIVHSRSKGEDK